MRKNKMNKGFTLAEVLLTLTIVGVVASITIPSIKANVDKAGYVIGVKKAYTVLQQAFTRAKTDNGGVIDTVFSNTMSNADSLNAFLNNMNVSQNCGTNSGCIYDYPVKLLDGNNLNNFYSSYARAILSDGMIIILESFANGCNSSTGNQVFNGSLCAYLYIDVNGFKPPNQLGRDFFWFWITKTGIYPARNFAYNIPCNNTEGWDCAAEVIEKGAMNY